MIRRYGLSMIRRYLGFLQNFCNSLFLSHKPHQISNKKAGSFAENQMHAKSRKNHKPPKTPKSKNYSFLVRNRSNKWQNFKAAKPKIPTPLFEVYFPCPEQKSLRIKAMLHGAIFLATCNAILLLRDVKLPNTSLHYTPLQPRTQGILLPVSENGPGIGRSHDLKISSIWGVQL